MGETHHAVIGIGSNIDPETHTRRALAVLGEAFTVRRTAAVRRTVAVGPVPAPDYLNGAVLIETALGETALAARLKELEATLGRVRTADRFAARTIDLDIVVYDGRIVDPDYHERAYLRELVAELGIQPA
jgi:2-amino-4-hydroxy-6-hydroxymethyldihydropteridine diphosphokinase